MIAPDILPILTVLIFLTFYNPTITTIFVYQRWRLRDLGTTKTIIVLTITFLATLVLLLLFQRLFRQGFAIWTILYGLALTVIVIGDRIAKWNKVRSKGKGGESISR